MADDLTYWKDFWDNQSTPLHRHNTDEWYRLYAKELNLILESVGYDGGSALETGCGNGALFDELNIDKTDYVGTDISENLIKIFQERHPELKLFCTDSASYYVDRKFSAIFSNGVIQYFNPQQLNQYVENCLKMLDKGGILLMANIPDRDATKKYHGGENQSALTSAIGSTKVALKRIFSGQKDIGNWYSSGDFARFKNSNIEMQVFGSLFHPYRFSVSLKKTL
jgi:cyclopropane fatty-acyl-phospholipid synthase-like methyltransferase